MQDACISGFPLESCGLFLGPINEDGSPKREITHVWPARNVQESARVYEVDPRDMFEASKYASANDLDIVGVYHSHTHSPAYPSPTDIKQSVDPKWCYAIASLAVPGVEIRYFSMDKGEVHDLQVSRV